MHSFHAKFLANALVQHATVFNKNLTLGQIFWLMNSTMTKKERIDFVDMHKMGGEPYPHRAF